MQGPEATINSAENSAPWTVVAFGVLQFLGLLLSAWADPDTAPRLLGWVLIAGALFWGLLKGARVAWIIALFFEALAIVGSVGVIVGRSLVDNRAFDLAQVALVVMFLFVLLHPRTREWCTRRFRLSD